MNPHDRAELVESIHQPWKATVEECIRRWDALDPGIRLHSYIVLQGDAGRRQTLNSDRIADLAKRMRC